MYDFAIFFSRNLMHKKCFILILFKNFLVVVFGNLFNNLIIFVKQIFLSNFNIFIKQVKQIH